jgi:probable HAF family extracellular repeat protein
VNTPSNWLRKVSLGLSAAVALGALFSTARGQTYGVTQIPTLGGSINTALAINNAGVVAGNSNLSGDTQTHAFSFSNGIATDLGTLGGNNSYANGINASGVVVGNAYTVGAAADLAFSDSKGVMTSLGTLSGTLSYAEGVNISGTVVGWATLAGNATHHAFSNTVGVMTDLGTLGGPNSTAYGINDSGTIVGTADYSASAHDAFSYSNGVMTDLGALGGTRSAALAINNEGYVVGYAMIATGGWFHAFIYGGGVMTDLGTVGGATGNSYAYGINNLGAIVGNSGSVGGVGGVAFLYANGKMTDLNTLVSLPGVTLTSAWGTNDLGQIVANGSDNRAYLLTPLSYHLLVTFAPAVDAGYPASMTVTVVDSNNNTVAGYSGTVHFTSSDGAAVLPADSMLTNGTKTFAVSLGTAGVQSITATDTQAASITGTTGPVTVHRAVAPSIGVAPVSVSANIGANAVFWVLAAGTQIHYQWSFNGTPIPGATNPILQDVGVVAGSAGQYTVSVTNLNGAVTSAAATLTVNANGSGNPIAFVGQPVSQTVASGSTVAFSASTGLKPVAKTARAANLVQGGMVVTYQWFRNGVAIDGATDPILVLSNAVPGYDGLFTCLAVDSAGALMSDAATLNVVAGASPGRLTNLSCRVERRHGRQPADRRVCRRRAGDLGHRAPARCGPRARPWPRSGCRASSPTRSCSSTPRPASSRRTAPGAAPRRSPPPPRRSGRFPGWPPRATIRRCSRRWRAAPTRCRSREAAGTRASRWPSSMTQPRRPAPRRPRRAWSTFRRGPRWARGATC